MKGIQPHRYHDYRDLKARIQAAGLLERYPHRSGAALAAVALLFGLGLFLLIRFREPWGVALSAIFLAIVTVQIAFLVHDAGHRQLFAPRWQNTLVGLICGDLLLGVSYGWWVEKHNRHHANPNHADLDPDIDLPLIAFSPEQAAEKRGMARWIIKHQVIFAVPLLSLVVYGQRLSSLQFLFAGPSRYRRWEFVAQLAHYALYLGVPLVALGPWSALLFFVVHHACAGIYLGLVFAPNHKGMLITDDSDSLDPLRAQVLTARNVRSHPLVDWWYGGLNYQIEHHLFPALPRHSLGAAQPIIRTFCRERGVPYHETSMVGSYREILHYLHAMGAPLRAGIQAEAPSQTLP
ncbi:MAG: acyl-CoA desaturase [Chloroflexia bacterium]